MGNGFDQRRVAVPSSNSLSLISNDWRSEVATCCDDQCPLAQTERPMPAKEKSLEDLFHETLKDIYMAEKRILTALPKMAKAVNSDELRQAFEKHVDETEGQLERLDKVFELIGKPAKGKKCEAIEGLIAEGQEIMKDFKNSDALDAGLLSEAQAVEHYEISRYGTLITWANELGHSDAVPLLAQTLEEEKKTDATLTQIAESTVNQRAAA
jgi:ferritin-like metal-binding protein YciE